MSRPSDRHRRCTPGHRASYTTRATVFAIVLAAGCGDRAGLQGPVARPVHAMVGTYALTARFDRFQADVRRPESTRVDAAVTGVVVVGDTVEDRGGGTVYFADVRYTGRFCSPPVSCEVPERYASGTSLFAPHNAVTLGWASNGGVTTLHLEGTFAGDSITGPAYYQVGMSRYDGAFVARRQPTAAPPS